MSKENVRRQYFITINFTQRGHKCKRFFGLLMNELETDEEPPPRLYLT